MADNKAPLNRADSLITGRRRTFIASPRAETVPAVRAVPVMPKLADVVFPENEPAEDEDIPLLTEVVAPEAAVSEASSGRFDETLVSILAADLAHSIETRFAIELPALIETTLDCFQQDLRRGITAVTEAALKDFIGRRQQLRLPLDEPNIGD
jgi:hypothetical protein